MIRTFVSFHKKLSAAGALALFFTLTPALRASEEAAAEHLFDIVGFPVTNSMVTSWVVSVALIILVRLAIGRPGLVPSRGQAIVESVVEGVREVVEPIVGHKAIRASFPLLIGLFIYILIQNWSGLLPGVGSVVHFEGGHWTPVVRPGHADMNGTFALALVSFVAWIYLIIRYAGPKAILYDIFGNKAEKNDVPAILYYFLFLIFFLVGLIEIVSIIFRPISLSLRLFGNVFGGENLMASMSAIFQWGLPIPFYFLELLIGFVQALVFTLLVAVYIGLICNHGDDHAGESGAPVPQH